MLFKILWNIFFLKNILENGTFTPEVQMFHFPEYFQKYDIAKVPRGAYVEEMMNTKNCVKIIDNAI